ncbi:SusE domain-containing protein [Mucilaginibacter sp. JRF]|uniref:SusE domain-containing protein n=1 Tax=Mucilaginibacter sp. JRF TaxID=2780088 RepID=UPI00187E991A|nr:SusE domain-containing protein [Mucilaginibacter sp. JRF]MBE9585555.1 SusE domain-containing protein [Mucilaginibacter sp. JRF]
MKTLYKKLLALGCAGMLIISACKKDENRAVLSSNAKGGTISASASTLVLEKATETENVITLNFTEPEFGFSAAATNTLQLAISGTNFAPAKEVELEGKVKSLTYTGLDFNSLLLALNLPFDSPTEVELRVKSELNSTVAPVYSNVLKLTVTPYPLISWVYVPGNYQGWNPATADSLISATGNGVYKGTIYFPVDAGANYEFKITPAKNWNSSYGDAGGGSVSTGGGNFKAPAAGSYQITLDLNTNTIEMAKDSWGVIGDATPGGWDADTDMIYNNGNNTWSITVNLVGGKFFKFRYNDDWGVNLGGTPSALTQGGADINVATSGSYRIVLDVAAKTYTITKL